jgi:hypothetical protein
MRCSAARRRDPPALQSPDVAYHLNHCRDGVIMYELATRTTLKGSGTIVFVT